MNRRRAWIVGGGVLAALALVGAGVWVWQTSSIRPSPDSSQISTAAPTPTADLRTLAQQELDDHLKRCTAAGAGDGDSSDAAPEGCGIRIPWGTEFAAVDGVRFRVERLPVLELVGDDFIADGGILVATVSGTGQDGAARTETYRTESWSVRGDVEVSDGEVDLDVW